MWIAQEVDFYFNETQHFITLKHCTSKENITDEDFLLLVKKVVSRYDDLSNICIGIVY